MMSSKPSWLILASFVLLFRLASALEPSLIFLPYKVMAVDIEFECNKDLQQMDIIVSGEKINPSSPFQPTSQARFHGLRVKGNGKTCEMETGVFSKSQTVDFPSQPYGRQTKPIPVTVTNSPSLYQASFHKESFFLTKSSDHSLILQDLHQGEINPQTLFFYGDQMPKDIYIWVPRGSVPKGKTYQALLNSGNKKIFVEFKYLKPFGKWKGKEFREFGTIYHYSFDSKQSTRFFSGW